MLQKCPKLSEAEAKHRARQDDFTTINPCKHDSFVKIRGMLIYKICSRALWDETFKTGVFPGMPIDVVDGYVHFSTAEQQAETARKYFTGQTDLMLLTVESDGLGERLRFEPSSSGTRPGLFPHLYGTLKLTDIISAEPFSVE